jgi:hypothetical protein
MVGMVEESVVEKNLCRADDMIGPFCNKGNDSQWQERSVVVIRTPE